MAERNLTGYIPKGHIYLWWVLRAGLMLWGVYGLFHNSVTEFLEAIFAILFTHLWDFFQIFGGRSFITRLSYQIQTLLNVFIFVGVVVGSTLNNRTGFKDFDLVTHFAAGFVAAWGGYELAFLIQGKKGRLSPALAALFSFTFSLGIAVGWEIYEFSMDRLYGMHLQQSYPMSEGGLIDTMVDFIMASIGALVGMFIKAFSANGVLGKSRAEIKQKIREEKRLEALKEKVWEDYLYEQNRHNHGQPG